MQGYKDRIRWQQVHGKKRPHWGILTLDDLPKTSGKYSQMMIQLQARYKTGKELGEDKPNWSSEDYSI